MCRHAHIPEVGARGVYCLEFCIHTCTLTFVLQKRRHSLRCMHRRSACVVPRFFAGEQVGQRVVLQVLVTGIVTNHEQKIPQVCIALSECRSHQLH